MESDFIYHGAQNYKKTQLRLGHSLVYFWEGRVWKGRTLKNYGEKIQGQFF